MTIMQFSLCVLVYREIHVRTVMQDQLKTRKKRCVDITLETTALKETNVLICTVRRHFLHSSTVWHSHGTVEPLFDGTSKYLLLYKGCPLLEVKLYWHGPVGTTELVFYREVKCIVSEGPFIREVPLQ